ncbi:hypothetical protein BO94DRAFT_15163 [Aspergillus sclerotioniger CBS 115572]|uniref:Secreted protein n=1 Tax=Aspergillus sclerotioniger CBS 115572 TaxID=1450535 RepID=A0A317XDH7_9EURO|nr:hypothetical protein BO94DRAFT_15163 [Aspergillus sclerotioniger CBS 115572]PWY96589.1 hypothetical protein BO94DRAFT_15163 [Aspergillus sclerotioniger CBS 115572]
MRLFSFGSLCWCMGVGICFEYMTSAFEKLSDMYTAVCYIRSERFCWILPGVIGDSGMSHYTYRCQPFEYESIYLL